MKRSTKAGKKSFEKIDKHNKLVKTAEKSPLKWATVAEYILDNVASVAIKKNQRLPSLELPKKQNIKVPSSKSRRMAYGFLNYLSFFLETKFFDISHQPATLFGPEHFTQSNTATTSTSDQQFKTT